MEATEPDWTRPPYFHLGADAWDVLLKALEELEVPDRRPPDPSVDE